MPIKAKIANGTLILELPINKAPSKTGKNIVIATTRGNARVDGLTFEGKQVVVGVNAYFAAA